MTPEQLAKYKQHLLERHDKFDHHLFIEDGFSLTDCFEKMKPYVEESTDEMENFRYRGYFLRNDGVKCSFDFFLRFMIFRSS